MTRYMFSLALLTITMESAGCADGSPATLEDGGGFSDGPSSADANGDGGGIVVPGGEYDVVVVGATTGGVAAAIGAARAGARVLLLEETDWVGGQASAGTVSTFDEYTHDLDYTGGLYIELRDRIAARYSSAVPPRSTATCYFGDELARGGTRNRFCFEPFVVREEVLAMLAEEPGVEVVLRARVTAVERAGDVVTGVVADVEPSGERMRVTAGVVVDATEYGDLLPLAGARYRLGNRTSDELDPGAHIQNFTAAGVIRRYPGGVPRELIVPHPLAHYDEEVASFRTLVPYATGFTAGSYTRPWNFAHHAAYRGMPNSMDPISYTAFEEDLISKTALNAVNEIPGLLRAAHISDPAERRRIDCEGRRRTINFLYYFQSELGMQDWSVATEEGFDTPHQRDHLCDASIIPAELQPIERHLGIIPYARESRRAIGVFTVTGWETERIGLPTFADALEPAPTARTRFPTAVGIGTIPTDLLHGCYGSRCLELELESFEDSTGGGAYQLPLEALVPETIDGLVMGDKDVSGSRIVLGAHRTQGATMSTGQAAGVLAALAVLGGVAPRDVQPIEVQRELLAQKSALSLWSFGDVPPSHPRWADVQLVSLRDVQRGTDYTFGVDVPTDRNVLARILTNLFSLPLASCTSMFADVGPGHFCDSIEAVARAGLVDPVSAGRFGPDGGATRAVVATALARGFSLSPATSGSAFSDVDATHPAFGAIQALADVGLAASCDAGAFCPDAVPTRGETASLIAPSLARAPTAPLAEPETRVTSARTVEVRWTRAWSTSEVVDYEYAAGTTPGGTDLVRWTSSGTERTAQISVASLAPGQAMYASVRARTADGVLSRAWAARSVRVDRTAPDAVDLAARLTPSGVVLRSNAFDGSQIRSVRFAIDGAPAVPARVVDRRFDSPYEREASFPPGAMHEVVAIAENAAGLTRTCTARFADPIALVAASPAACGLVNGTVLVEADAARDGAVEVLVDGASIGSDPRPPYAVAWDASALSPGSHTLLLRQTAAGASHTFTVDVDGTAPTISVSSAPAPDGRYDVTAAAGDDRGLRTVSFFYDAPVDVIMPPLATAPTATARLGALADLDGDHASELVFQDGSRIEVVHAVAGATPVAAFDPASCTIPAGALLVGSGDFDRDAQADLVFQEQAAMGRIVLWLMDRKRCRESVEVNRTAGPARVAGVADFDGDGGPDLIFQVPSPAEDYAVIWVMRGTAHAGTAAVSRPVAHPFQIIGAADFDADGENDVLFYEPSSGALIAWLMRGLARRASRTLPGTAPGAPPPVAIGELDRDWARPEIVRRSATGVIDARTFAFRSPVVTMFDAPYSGTLSAGTYVARATDLAGNVAEAPFQIP